MSFAAASLLTAGAPAKRRWAWFHADESGATLIEALLVIVLLGTLAAAIFGIYSTGYSVAKRAQSLEQATLLAEQRLEQLKASAQCDNARALSQPREPVDPTNSSGFAWEVDAQKNGPRLNQITVTVFWSEGGQERQISLATYLRTRGGAP